MFADDNRTPFKEHQPIVELFSMGDEKLCCSVHKLSDLHQALTSGHVYFSLACTTDNLVYQRNSSPLPKVLPETFEQLIDQSRHGFTIGMSKARKIFEGAAYYQRVSEHALSMFMLQQATETTFRTTAIALYGSERRTHSIRSLKRFNQRLAPQLNDIFPGGSPDEDKLLQLLEDAYLGARYNPDYQISEQEVHSISSRVLCLLELAEAVFEERVATIRV